MKRLVLASILLIGTAGGAFAADLAMPAPPPQAPAVYGPSIPPVYNWSGIYLGINGGWGFGTSKWSDPLNPVGSGSFDTSGGLIGGTIGVNWQTEAFVFGVEGDIDWQNLTGTSANAFCSNILTPAGLPGTCNTQSNWLSTFRGRVGFAADRVLFYGTAGGAAGNVQTGLGGLSLQSNTEFGWSAGAGVEVAFAENWTARVEYLFIDLGKSNCNQSASCGFDAGPIPANNSVSFTENIVRAGIDFKFR